MASGGVNALLGARGVYKVAVAGTVVFTALFAVPLASDGSDGLFAWLMLTWSGNRLAQSLLWSTLIQMVGPRV